MEFRAKTYAGVVDEYYIPELRATAMNGYAKLSRGRAKVLGIMDISHLLSHFSKWLPGFDNFLMVYEQGARLALGNDTIPPCTAAAMDVELAMFDHFLNRDPDRKPFSGADAVKIATINSARSLGLEEEFGSIETGKTADLVILDGDPLEDFRVIGSRVAALFVDGKLVINNCGLSVESAG